MCWESILLSHLQANGSMKKAYFLIEVSPMIFTKSAQLTLRSQVMSSNRCRIFLVLVENQFRWKIGYSKLRNWNGFVSLQSNWKGNSARGRAIWRLLGFRFSELENAYNDPWNKWRIILPQTRSGWTRRTRASWWTRLNLNRQVSGGRQPGSTIMRNTWWRWTAINGTAEFSRDVKSKLESIEICVESWTCTRQEV